VGRHLAAPATLTGLREGMRPKATPLLPIALLSHGTDALYHPRG